MSSEQIPPEFELQEAIDELPRKLFFANKPEPITLTLTREQAEAIADILADVLHYGPSVELEELKKQIEEKLK